MIVLVVSKMEDGDFKVREAYFDRGGLKRMSALEKESVDWANTLQEVQMAIDESLYKTSQYMNLASVDELDKIFGMKTDEFISKYQNQFVRL